MANSNRHRENYKARLKRRRKEGQRFLARLAASNQQHTAKGLPLTGCPKKVRALAESLLSRDI